MYHHRINFIFSFISGTSATEIYTDNQALASAVMRGDGLITGLAGESWTRLVGGAFT